MVTTVKVQTSDIIKLPHDNVSSPLYTHVLTVQMVVAINSSDIFMLFKTALLVLDVTAFQQARKLLFTE